MTHQLTCRECGHVWNESIRGAGRTARCRACGRLAVAGDCNLVDDPSPTDQVVARAAVYIPTWGTSVVVHLALLLFSLIFAWSVVRSPDPPEYKAGFERQQPVKFAVPRSLKYVDHAKPNSRKLIEELQVGLTNLPDLGPGEIIAYTDAGDENPFGGGGIHLVGPDDFGPRGNTGTELFPGTTGDVVYVVDCSGSMTDSVQTVKQHLKTVLRGLRPPRRFHVIFFSSGPPREMPSRTLLLGTPANKETAYEFIDGVVPMGQTEPMEALKRALSLRPDEIVFLTDGEFDKQVVTRIRQLNRSVKARINTICFIYTTGEPLLMQIAHENNGTYRFVGADDVGL